MSVSRGWYERIGLVAVKPTMICCWEVMYVITEKLDRGEYNEANGRIVVG